MLKYSMLCAVFFALLLQALISWSEESPESLIQTKPTIISLFKNGLAFVRREAVLPENQEVAVINGLPTVVHGTFWVHAPGKDGVIKDVVGFRQDRTEALSAVDLRELILANVGQNVEIILNDNNTLRGTILPVPDRAPVDAASFVRIDQRQTTAASFVLLRNEKGTVAINQNDIHRVAGTTADLRMDFIKKKTETALRIRTTHSSSDNRIAIEYLCRGMTWAPSCVIDITNDKQADLSVKAEILNELEDLDHVQVHFITGFPNLAYAGVIDPITLRTDFDTFVTTLSNPPRPDPSRSPYGAVAQQGIFVARDSATISETMPAYVLGPAEGQTREELFFYEKQDISLKKGERGYYPLYAMKVPYDHVYEWSVPDMLDEQERYRTATAQEPVSPEKVWHSLRMTNTGKIPWTTAPIAITQGGQLIGQDLLYYTSPGSKTMVKITIAFDIKAEHAEYEVQRQRNAMRLYGYDYDLVDLRGVLKATNYKNKDIVLSISKHLSGEVVKTTPEGKIEKTAQGLKRMNPHNIVRWELPLKAGEK
ncbi:MAG TPA: hypothetical protein VJ521_08615, partial [Acidobacteriota bacterium]|nr:hypothetical protein [Acidobacteriota bacterium]